MESDSWKIPRHKVFISYFHKDDQSYKDLLIDRKEINQEKRVYQSIFDDYSVHEDEIDDQGKSAETIRKIIRDEYIKQSSVLILLCGQRTKERKYIDWELHAAMFDTEENPKLGILVINLPSVNQSCRRGEVEETELISPNGQWFSCKTREEFLAAFPYLPDRLIDNFVSKEKDDSIVPITVVDWNRIENNDVILKTLIDIAYGRGKDPERHYDTSSPLRGRNS